MKLLEAKPGFSRTLAESLRTSLAKTYRLKLFDGYHRVKESLMFRLLHLEVWDQNLEELRDE